MASQKIYAVEIRRVTRRFGGVTALDDVSLAALDLKLRKQFQLELRNLQRRLRMTFVYVTHDQDFVRILPPASPRLARTAARSGMTPEFKSSTESRL